MKVTLLEFKQNNTCNVCFNERADKFVEKHEINTTEFSFHGISIAIEDESNFLKSSRSIQPKHF